MSLTDLKDLTEELEDFSVGASPQSSTRQWDLKTYEDVTRDARPEYLSFYLQRRLPEREALARFVCHILIEKIPSQGIPELYETLQDIHEFYLPQVEQENLLLPQPRQIEARWGTTSVRPEFPVVYDEE